MKYNWPLAISTLTVSDRLKIGWRILRRHQMTAGAMVRKYEEKWEKYTGAKHAIMVTNGSLANELIAQHRKEQLISAGQWPHRNRVVFPVCNWVTSVAPWIRLGFVPVWVDCSQHLCARVEDIARVLVTDKEKVIGTVFYVTLLGQAAPLVSLSSICYEAGVELLLDNCESSLSFNHELWLPDAKHFCSIATSSTSFYFSHPATTGTEGGMVFCENGDDANWFRMMRNHGLTRGMPERYRNYDVHAAFDFHLLGTNARSSDLQAYMGLLTFDRTVAFAKERIRLATLFYDALDKTMYCDITNGRCENPMMALPILQHPQNGRGRESLYGLLDSLGIEHRPIVGGNLLRHTAFKPYGDARFYPRAQDVHDRGVYVGLHEGVTSGMVFDLAQQLNNSVR
jgi:dTDP-4-amino-4,6-dideoxygalactose transaminase